MTTAYIDLGRIVRFALLRDNTVIQLVTLDYGQELLSQLYSLMQGIRIDSIKCCMPSYFSQNLLNNSVALDEVQLPTASGFFCISIEDLQAIKHLAKSLNIPDVQITECRFFCREDLLYIFSLDNLYEVFTIVGGRLVEFDIVSEGQLEYILQQRCAKYNVQDYLNLAYGADIPYLISTFDNVFTVDDEDALSDLTFIAHMQNARMFSVDQYLNSTYSLQSLVGDDPDVPIRAEKVDPAIIETEEDKDFELSAKAKKRRVAKPDVVPSSPHDGDGDDDDDDDDVIEKPKKRSRVMIALVVMVIAMIGLNIGVYALNQNETAIYKSLYAAYTETTDELTELQSKYNMLSSQSTVSANENIYKLLKKAKLLNNKKIQLVNFKVEGSTVELSISVRSEDDFWDYYDTINSKYNISDVTEGNPDGKRKVFVINLIL